MNISDFKFTFYDIIGYLFCGAIPLLIIKLAFDLQVNTESSLTQYLINLIKVENTLSFLIIAYLTGRLVSTISSLIVEKIIFDGMLNKYYGTGQIENFISKKLSTVFFTKYSNIYKSEYSSDDWRILIIYAEENRPATYSTAFVFLVYYGMARNLMLIFLVSALFLVSTHFLIATILLVLFLIELYEYHRFRKYFHQQIIYAFINAQENNE